ncbi:MAG: hypothetical protein HC786_23215 [Richelia sp. CSU_2_1]|nr:hypothetical protein [Richelia sp. CSU_2_1]
MDAFSEFEWELGLLHLYLQLAGVNFETAHKTESGKEVSVTRSPDGKFASKNASSPSAISPTAVEAFKSASDTIKQKVSKAFAGMPGVLRGVQKTDIVRVAGGFRDPASNFWEFGREKYREAAGATSRLAREMAVGALSVAIQALAALASIVLSGATLQRMTQSLENLEFEKPLEQGIIDIVKEASEDTIKRSLEPKNLEPVALSDSIVQSLKRLAKGGAKTEDVFKGKQEEVRKAIEDEGLDFDLVLRAIAHRGEKAPDPARAREIEDRIRKTEREIPLLGQKAQRIVAGKYFLTASDIRALTELSRKEFQFQRSILEQKADLAAAEGRGFSLKKRVEELADLANKEGRDSPSYQWRRDVIKAELQYGEKLDKVGQFNGYTNLLNVMKQPAKAGGGYEPPSTGDREKLSDFFNKIGSFSVDRPPKAKVLVEEIARKSGKDLLNYLAVPLNIQVALEGGRTCCLGGGNTKYSDTSKESAKIDGLTGLYTATDLFKEGKVDGFINIGDADLSKLGVNVYGYDSLTPAKEHIKELTWHETGHILELKLGKVEESAAFREERAREVPAHRKESPDPGSTDHPPDFAEGQFYSPYIGLRMKGVGKYKDKDVATEVLSSGMELLSNPDMLKSGVKVDRETVLYALSAMQQKGEN